LSLTCRRGAPTQRRYAAKIRGDSSPEAGGGSNTVTGQILSLPGVVSGATVASVTTRDRQHGMTDRAALVVRLMAMSSVVIGLLACSRSPSAPATLSWDPKGAASYLDRRIAWWMGWSNAARDHGTFCVSCHTAVPYALARPGLDSLLGEGTSTAVERKLRDNVRRRVRLWDETEPFYADTGDAGGKSAESRGTDAVLSALLLAWDDARSGRLSADTRAAFGHMWAVQHTSGHDVGAWSWLESDEAPWEIDGARYYGAALAALAVGVAPDNYRALPQIQDHLQLLRSYLARNYSTQSLHDRVVLLWASTKFPGLLEPERCQSVVSDVLRAQNPDGGWSLSKLLSRSSEAGVLSNPDSDGYATGLITLALEQAGQGRDAVQRGLTWLVENQRGHGGFWIRGPEGFWIATSQNKHRLPWSNVGRFMADAATGFAVLALTQAPHAELKMASPTSVSIAAHRQRPSPKGIF